MARTYLRGILQPAGGDLVEAALAPEGADGDAPPICAEGHDRHHLVRRHIVHHALLWDVPQSRLRRIYVILRNVYVNRIIHVVHSALHRDAPQPGLGRVT